MIVLRCRSALPAEGRDSVPSSSSPTVRRRELGARLRALRNERGLTVEQLAEELLCSPSKVSRMETGQRGASARDIRDLARLYNLDEAQQQRLTDLAAEGKQHAWWQPLGLPDSYSTYVGLESEASLIRDFGLGLVPGLLQTRDYARAVLHATVPHRSADQVEQRVEARMARQQRLSSAANRPAFHAIIDVSVLYRVVGGRDVMKGQLERLSEASRMRNVTVQVIPYEAGALPIANNKFIMLSFTSPELSDVVFIEGLSGDLYLDHSEDIKTYTTAFGELEQLAATPSDTQAIISAMLAEAR
jgi:transcriptional regulator with XRE-family HTH domain